MVAITCPFPFPREGAIVDYSFFLVVMWTAFSRGVALFPSGSTNWMTKSATFSSCFNVMVILRLVEGDAWSHPQWLLR